MGTCVLHQTPLHFFEMLIGQMPVNRWELFQKGKDNGNPHFPIRVRLGRGARVWEMGAPLWQGAGLPVAGGGMAVCLLTLSQSHGQKMDEYCGLQRWPSTATSFPHARPPCSAHAATGQTEVTLPVTSVTPSRMTPSMTLPWTNSGLPAIPAWLMSPLSLPL